jgi:general stress protein 26
MTWSKLESRSTEIAEFAKARLHNKVAYLATVRKDGSPRVHPFTPIIGEGHFFVFMEPNSPKGNDLRRDGRLPFIVPYPIPAAKAVSVLSQAGRNLLKTQRCAHWQ